MTRDNFLPNLKTMEVHFSPEAEAQLHQLATRSGKEPEQLVQETVNRMLERQARFVDSVKRGMASADRGDLLEHEEVVERIERLFQS